MNRSRIPTALALAEPTTKAKPKHTKGTDAAPGLPKAGV